MDVAVTMLQVTLQAKLKSTVVLDAPMVRLVDRKPVEGGIIATYGAGGADLHPRHFEVDLDMFDPPVVRYMNEDLQVVSDPAFKLAAGDIERFQIWAYARGSDLVEWTLDIPVIVNGRRLMIPVQGPTDLSFRTLGSESGVRVLLREGEAWVEWE